MPGVTVILEEPVATGGDLTVDVPGLKHGDIDTDDISVAVDGESVDPDAVSFSIDVAREVIHVTNVTDHDWEVGNVVTLAWPDKEAA